MMTLYINPTCPFCIKTLAVVHELHIPLTIKNNHKEGISEEVIRIGGAEQYPFLVDDEHHVQMYESDDIIAYLKRQYQTD